MKIFLKKATEIVMPDFLKLEYDAHITAIILLHKLEPKILASDEYHEMRKIMDKDKKITNHFEKLVGNSYSLTRIEPNHILRTVISTMCFGLKENKSNTELLNTIYRDFESFFYNDEIEMVEIVPISNLRLTKIPIKLGNLTIRRITKDEKERFVEGEFGLNSIDYHLTKHVIEYKYNTKKITRKDDEKPDLSLKHHEKNPLEEILKLISALRIFHIGGFDYNIAISKNAGMLPFFGTATTSIGKQKILSTEYFLNNEKIEEFLKFWKKFYHTNYLNFKPNGIASRRYSSRFDKTNQEDILIDMLIAFEALFFKQGESGEITHKISVRISKFLETDLEQRKELFKHVKQIYHIRSAIVHGDAPSFDKTDFRDIHEMNEKITILLQRSLKKFIEMGIDSQKKHEEVITNLDLK